MHPPAPAPTLFGSKAGHVQNNAKSGPTLRLLVGNRGTPEGHWLQPSEILATPYGVFGAASPTALPGTTTCTSLKRILTAC